MLRQAQGHCQTGMQQAQDRAGQGRHQETRHQVGSGKDSEPAHHGAHRHDPLDPEVQDTGPLAQQRAEHAKDQRRGNAQDRRPKACIQEKIERFTHRRSL